MYLIKVYNWYRRNFYNFRDKLENFFLGFKTINLYINQEIIAKNLSNGNRKFLKKEFLNHLTDMVLILRH